MDGCVFCKMVAGEIPVTKVYEDEAVLAFLDIGPISDGHTLVIPKQHVAQVHECDPEVLAAGRPVWVAIAEAVVAAMEADGYNVLSNNGRAAGQVVDHLHFHIIPRKIRRRGLHAVAFVQVQEGPDGGHCAKIRENLADT